VDSNIASKNAYSPEDGVPPGPVGTRECPPAKQSEVANFRGCCCRLGFGRRSGRAPPYSLRRRWVSVNSLLSARCRQMLQPRRAILGRVDRREVVRNCRAGRALASSSMFNFVASAPGSGATVPSCCEHAIATPGLGPWCRGCSGLTAAITHPLSLDTLQAADTSAGNRSRLHRRDRAWRP